MPLIQDLEYPQKLPLIVFYDLKHHLQARGRGGAVKIFSQTMTESMNNRGVCIAALASPGSA